MGKEEPYCPNCYEDSNIKYKGEDEDNIYWECTTCNYQFMTDK